MSKNNSKNNISINYYVFGCRQKPMKVIFVRKSSLVVIIYPLQNLWAKVQRHVLCMSSKSNYWSTFNALHIWDSEDCCSKIFVTDFPFNFNLKSRNVCDNFISNFKCTLKNTQLYWQKKLNLKITLSLSFNTLYIILGICFLVKIRLQNHYTARTWNICFASLIISSSHDNEFLRGAIYSI